MPVVDGYKGRYKITQSDTKIMKSYHSFLSFPIYVIKLTVMTCVVLFGGHNIKSKRNMAIFHVTGH